MHPYVWYFLCAFAGFLFQSAAKLSGLQKDANVANINFDWRRDYLQRDSFSIILSALSPLIWLLVYDEWVERYHIVEEYLKTSFVLFGAIGSWGLQYIFGSAKKWIRSVVDRKTDELDLLRDEVRKLKNKTDE